MEAELEIVQVAKGSQWHNCSQLKTTTGGVILVFPASSVTIRRGRARAVDHCTVTCTILILGLLMEIEL